MANTVLIFGSRGMLAHDIINSFQKKGFAVVGVDIEECDITKEELVKKIIYETKPILVINSAVRLSLDECEADPTGATLVNALGPFFIAKYSKELDIPMVQISTIYVFNGEKTTAYFEYDLPNPVNIYGVTKLNAENLVKITNPKHYIIRTNFLFGKKYNAALKGAGNFVERVFLLLKSGVIKIVTDQIVSMTYTKDLVDVIIQIINKQKYGTYHVANSGYASLYSIAEKILTLSGINSAQMLLPAKLSDFQAKFGRPQHTITSSIKLQEIGIPNLRNWEDALGAYLKETGRFKNKNLM